MTCDLYRPQDHGNFHPLVEGVLEAERDSYRHPVQITPPPYDDADYLRRFYALRPKMHPAIAAVLAD